MRWIVFAVLAAASFSAAAGTVDVNLSNDTVEGKYDTTFGAADLTFGGMYNRDQKNYALNAGLLGKVYTVHIDGPSADVVALALGGQLRWFPGSGSFAIGGYAFYSPKVVTFLDGKSFYDVGLRAEVEVFRNSFAYLGIRWTRAELDDGSQPYVDKGGFAGLRIIF